MDASGIVKIKGAPGRSILGASVLALIAVVICWNLLQGSEATRVKTSLDRWILVAGLSGCALSSFLLSRRASTLRKVVVTMSPAGFRDERIAAMDIPWTAITSMSIHCVGRRYWLALALDPLFKDSETFRSLSPRLYKLKSVFGFERLVVYALGLRGSPSQFVESVHRYWRSVVERELPPDESAIFLAKAEDKTLARFREVTAKRPYFSFAILAVLAAIFIGQIDTIKMYGGYFDTVAALSPSSLMLDGGLRNDLVDQGQWWRFFTAPLLHGGFPHLLMNGIALVFSGYLLEGLIGWQWFGAIFAVSALAGGLASYVWDFATVVSVGASGGIVGLFGAALVLAMRYPQGAMRSSMMTGALRVLLPTLLPFLRVSYVVGGARIDVAAHVGGAMGGALLAGVMRLRWKEETDAPDHRREAAGLFGAFCVCATFAFMSAAQYRDLVIAMAPSMPASFQTQISQSADLMERYPRDPRVKYARAVALYNEDRMVEARAMLEAILSDKAILTLAPVVEPPARSLLGAIYKDEGRQNQAKAVVAPICGTKDQAVRTLVADICD